MGGRQFRDLPGIKGHPCGGENIIKSYVFFRHVGFASSCNILGEIKCGEAPKDYAIMISVIIFCEYKKSLSGFVPLWDYLKALILYLRRPARMLF